MNAISLSPFRFSTKAGNLAQLHGRLSTARTVELEVVMVGQWRLDRPGCTAMLQDRFGKQRLIVRSSAPGEDSAEASMAGAFDSVLDVDCADAEAIGVAIDEVADGYAARRTGDIDDYEILIQPMVERVRASGVVFTRDLDRGGPYYLLNYDDESARTDTITGGYTSEHKVIRIFRGVDTEAINDLQRAVVLAAKELEEITGTDALDIEFAIDYQGVFYLLQVRPLARTRIFSFQRLDSRVGDEIRYAKEFLQEKFRRLPGLFGETTIFGEMPDWNPAEIIGTQPKQLASSLYSHIIMKQVWRDARQLCGYRNPHSYQLLSSIAGRPYVDVRASFNSFLPATLRPELCEKLVNYYLARLKLHPEYHDKIEFEIVISVLDFDFEKDAERLRGNGFTDHEIEEIRASLLGITNTLVNDHEGMLARLERDVEQLSARREQLLSMRQSATGIPVLVEQLLEDCIKFGTLPFSVFARCAFIGNSFLKSIVRRGGMTSDQLEAYHHSISTVTGDFVSDLDCCKSGRMPIADFLSRYGHLRPGTYDICAHCYSERPETYLGVEEGAAMQSESAGRQREPSGPEGFPASVESALSRMINDAGFSFDVRQLDQFVVKAIQLREAVKFEFTKNLSAVLTLLVEFGNYHGISRECLSFLPIERVLVLANQSMSESWLTDARQTIERNRQRYELTGAINLPDLLFSTKDLEVVSLQRRRPNFVTQGRLIAKSVLLNCADQLDELPDLVGRIVLIENADPGFDWLFARGIGGLVTKYGGAASHMTIRCAELGLPAAIGCGEQIFQELSSASSILLDCGGSRVESNEI